MKGQLIYEVVHGVWFLSAEFGGFVLLCMQHSVWWCNFTNI